MLCSAALCCRLDEVVRGMRGPNERVMEFVDLPQTYIRNRVSKVPCIAMAAQQLPNLAVKSLLHVCQTSWTEHA
jgi:hypothetical protein